MSNPTIPALYFDKDGKGPDHVFLEVAPIRGDDVMPASIALRVRAGNLVIRADTDGGYWLQREQAEALHKALGEWLHQ